MFIFLGIGSSVTGTCCSQVRNPMPADVIALTRPDYPYTPICHQPRITVALLNSCMHGPEKKKKTPIKTLNLTKGNRFPKSQWRQEKGIEALVDLKA